MMQEIPQIPQSIIYLLIGIIFSLIGLIWGGMNKKNKEQDEKIESNAKAHSSCQLETQGAVLRLENKVDTGFAAITGQMTLLSQQISNLNNGNGKH